MSPWDIASGTETHELVCSPGDFFELLKGIVELKDQETAIERGVLRLFIYERTDCIDTLLAAFDGKEFPSEHLKGIAIRAAFKEGAVRHNEIWTKSFYDHPAITPVVYADGLIASGRFDAQAPVFQQLLAAANHGDLRAVQMWDRYREQSAHFQEAIENALLKTKLGGTRHKYTGPKTQVTEKVVSGIASVAASQAIVGIIASYVTEE